MSSADLFQPSSSRNNQPRLVVNVDDRHPFDLDAYAGQFEGPSTPSLPLCSEPIETRLTALPLPCHFRPFLSGRCSLCYCPWSLLAVLHTLGRVTGRTLISRLARIHSLCPSLRPLTSALALPLIKEQTFDLNAFDHFGGEPNDPWRTGANRLAGDELEKLETELRSVTANLIKESIRVRSSPPPSLSPCFTSSLLTN